MNVESIEKAEIFPLNPPSNSAYSFKGGFPIVQFQIANQDKMLDASTLRLNGTLRVQAPGGDEANPIFPTNNPTSAASATNGISLSNRVGVASCLQQITLATQSNQTLEVIRSYGRYLSSVMSVTHSDSDFNGSNQQGNPASSSKSGNSAKAVNVDVSFSIPLRTGLLSSGQPIPLGTNGFRGMLINLELAPDSQVLGPLFTYNAANTEAPILYTAGIGAFYQLRDLSLTYDLLVPDDTGKNAMSSPATGQFTYNSISHLYGVINSSDQTQNYNLGTSKTLAVFHNFIPTQLINNFSADGFATRRLANSNGGAYDQDADINRVSFIRGGSKFPLDYAVDVRQGTDVNSGLIADNRPQTDLDMRYIDSIKPFSSFNHSLISLNTQNALPVETGIVNLQELPVNKDTQADPRPVFGAGINLDPMTKSGVDFKNTNYAIRIESDLDGNSPNSIYSYVVAQNTLTYSPNGIMVQS